jgi:hypothetical protein
LATPEPIEDRLLMSLKEKLIEISAKVVSRGVYVAFEMAEVAIPRNPFTDIPRLTRNCRRRPSRRPCEAFDGRALVAIHGRDASR